MTPAEFTMISEMLKQRSGLILGEDKKYLLESRLRNCLKNNNLADMSALAAALKQPGSENLKSEVTEAMTINESFFFRDKMPFENFKEVMVPHMVDARAAKKQLRIWCAAASTGQEPYSLAICVKDLDAQLSKWRVEILGTDLSNEVLEKARAGLYSQFEVQRGLPIQTLMKYFKQVGSLWQIESALKAMVKYKAFNLLESFTSLGRFDIVFCRNVLIYFDIDTKRDILERVAQQMEPDGYLVLGAAETIVGITDKFKPVKDRRGLYELASCERSAANDDSGARRVMPSAAGSFSAGQTNSVSAPRRSA